MTGNRTPGMPCQHRLALETNRNTSLPLHDQRSTHKPCNPNTLKATTKPVTGLRNP